MIRNFQQSKRKKIRHPSGNFDSEVGREIERQAQEKQEIETKRKKRKLIFWSLIILGTAIAVGVAVVLSDLAEW